MFKAINQNILCFTTSYKRPYHLRSSILAILNQSHQNIKYCVGVSIDQDSEESDYKNLLSDLLKDSRLNLCFHKNLSQHENYLYPIKHNNNYNKYNLFIKIDDDDIYKLNYIEVMLKYYKKYKSDVLSSNIKYQLNNNKLYTGNFDNVGGYWYKDLDSNTKFGMPFSYIFNKKALNVLLNTSTKELQQIHPFEDAGWRQKWRDNNITSKVLDNIDCAIYNIHGNNISSHHFLIRQTDENYEYIEHQDFIVAYFKHFCWESYCFIDKINNRITNMNNNDHGNISINDTSKKITIKWDKYPVEQFIKKNEIFKYTKS